MHTEGYKTAVSNSPVAGAKSRMAVFVRVFTYKMAAGTPGNLPGNPVCMCSYIYNGCFGPPGNLPPRREICREIPFARVFMYKKAVWDPPVAKKSAKIVCIQRVDVTSILKKGVKKCVDVAPIYDKRVCIKCVDVISIQKKGCAKSALLWIDHVSCKRQPTHL